MAEFKVDCFFNSDVAFFLDIPEALILSRIHYFAKKNEEKKDERRFLIEGEWWMCETGPGFTAKYPFLSLRTVWKAIKNLRDAGLIKVRDGSCNGNRTNYYTANESNIVQFLHDMKEDPSCRNCTIDSAETARLDTCIVQKLHDDSAETARSLSIQESSKVKRKNKSKERETVNSPLSLEELPKEKSPKYESEDIEIGKLWLEYATREMPWTKLPGSWTEIGFAEALAKIRRMTNLNHSGLQAVLNFVSNDPFWVRNSLSPASLLKKSKNDVRKIDNILSQMPVYAKFRQEEKFRSWGPVTEEELNNPFG